MSLLLGSCITKILHLLADGCEFTRKLFIAVHHQTSLQTELLSRWLAQLIERCLGIPHYYKVFELTDKTFRTEISEKRVIHHATSDGACIFRRMSYSRACIKLILLLRRSTPTQLLQFALPLKFLPLMPFFFLESFLILLSRRTQSKHLFFLYSVEATFHI